jgi:hypothetical protein
VIADLDLGGTREDAMAAFGDRIPAAQDFERADGIKFSGCCGQAQFEAF